MPHKDSGLYCARLGGVAEARLGGGTGAGLGGSAWARLVGEIQEPHWEGVQI